MCSANWKPTYKDQSLFTYFSVMSIACVFFDIWHCRSIKTCMFRHDFVLQVVFIIFCIWSLKDWSGWLVFVGVLKYSIFILWFSALWFHFVQLTRFLTICHAIENQIFYFPTYGFPTSTYQCEVTGLARRKLSLLS